VTPDHVRLAIVGSGFSGLAMAAGLRRDGIDDFVILEKAADVGGTWRDNTYPGCQCDVPSHLYSFSFALNPDWSRTYSLQPEIERYLRRTAEELDLLRHVRFSSELLDASWDDTDKVWRVATASGDLTCDVLVLGQGPLSEPRAPEITGIDTFEGEVWHSARWPEQATMQGRRVAVIGTGASAIQIVPEIQPEVAHLDVYQRTAPWVLPHRDRPIRAWERAMYRRFPVLQRLVRAGVYWARELLIFGLAKDTKRLKGVERLARRHIEKQVADPELREKVTPTYTPGCKRLLPSNHWYPAITSDNVELVTDPIVEITPTGVVTADGTERPCDTLVLATGFKVTNHPIGFRIKGRDGETLGDLWSRQGMQGYKGTTISGFPNLVMLSGPNTGIGHTSLVVMIEAQVDYVLDMLRTLGRRAAASFDVKPEVQARFNDDLQKKMKRTVWNAGGCASWYLDDHGRNTTLWPDFTFRFVRMTKRFDPDAYVLEPRTVAA